ncbi:TetR/AcrR family transcriptional regulator C-terminal domain-containing protein [Streptomyces sp. NPDC058382]|uniref:TetR/AcrR family transcriptional regulator C-terminal domain-containing protein n=1 Tax=unclassified Streptomyces TaxID=2593676 RepID=UPI003645009E
MPAQGGAGHRLDRLAPAGRLRRCDPAEAAERFLALLTGPLDARSRFGTRDVPEAELRQVGRSALCTFLRAYGVPSPALGQGVEAAGVSRRSGAGPG